MIIEVNIVNKYGATATFYSVQAKFVAGFMRLPFKLVIRFHQMQARRYVAALIPDKKYVVGIVKIQS